MALLPAQHGERREQDEAQRSSGRPSPQPPALQHPGSARGRERGDPEAGQILEVIGDEREQERVDVEEAQRRKQRPDEEQRSRKRPARPLPQKPERRQDEKRRDGVQVLPEDGLADVPAGIDEAQIRRPRQLAHVEPDGTPRDQGALRHAEIERRAFRPSELALHPDGEETGGDAEDEEGNERQDVLSPGEPSALPPTDEEQRRRQGRRHRLAAQREQEEAQRQRIEPGRSLLPEAKP